MGPGSRWNRPVERDEPQQLLEMQTRPSFIFPAMEAAPQIDCQIILPECSSSQTDDLTLEEVAAAVEACSRGDRM